MRSGRRFVWLSLVFALMLVVSGCASKHEQSPSPGVNFGRDGKPAAYREPVRLRSKDGLLEVRLSAHQGSIALDTSSAAVSGFLLFGYTLVHGTSSDGSVHGSDLYPAPTLRVDPGERLIVHFDNDLRGLQVSDFYSPQFTPVGQPVPLYPSALTSAPINLHTHGLHVSPDGNADNVLLDIPAGLGNVYDYAIPRSMPSGMYWYHSHLHTLTAQQTYRGLAGLLEIGRPDGNLPLVSDHHLPIRTMALQYNFVFDRKGSGAHLNDPNWPQFVSTLRPPEGNQLTDGTYQPSLAPVNFAQTTAGAQYFTNWYTGPLSPDNHRGQNQFVPSNLQTFTSRSTRIAADPSLPDNERDVQYTVNGQFQPELRTPPGQTEIWVLANITDFAYLPVTLTETATGKHPKFAIVGQDGNPFTTVEPPVDGDGTRLVIPPGSRYAIAVTMPERGDLRLEMPPLPKARPVTNPGVLYTNDGTVHAKAVLGNVAVDPSVISYADGFFTFPTQKLLTVAPDAGRGTTVAFPPGMALGAYTSFVNTAAMTPDVTRNLVVSGGFSNDKASKDDPKAFTYEFANNTFPNIPLIQPRLNSVEEWVITNKNNDEHPMHIHVNDFQVMQIFDPVAGTTTGVQMWGEDNVNVPAPVTDDQENPLVDASTTLRTEFSDYTGTFVIHCHRLNHEDNGLMAVVNVIPQVSSYASAAAGRVTVFDGRGDRPMATVTPFPGFTGTPSVAMADVNGDTVLDLVVGTGPGVTNQVVVYDGASGFTKELARFSPFGAGFTGGVTVAGADIDGNALADNIIAGAGPGLESQVKVFDSALPRVGQVPTVFSSFAPYPGSKSGVTVATGTVELASGRHSIVTAPGPGDAPRVKVFRYDLYAPTAAAGGGAASKEPVQAAEFAAFDDSYRGGVSLAVGWVAGAEGGAQSIVTGQSGDEGMVRTWSSGSRLDGAPAMYTHAAGQHGSHLEFRQTSSFVPTAGSGVHVAVTSTTEGADLLVSGPSGITRYVLARPDPSANTVAPTLVATVPTASGALGGR